MSTHSTYRIRFVYSLILILGLQFLVCGTALAQQDSQYTQYMYNTVSVNPAYAGSRGQLSVAALHRSQWVGLEGAPTTQTLNVHSPIGYRGVGLGMSIVNEKIGPTSETYFDADFSYAVRISQEGRINFGLKGSLHLLDVRFSDLDEYGIDQTLQQDIDNKLSPNVGAGVYYHTDRFYAGISVPRILETSHFMDGPSPTIAQEKMNFYLIAGYVWDLNPYLKFKPTLLTKAVRGAPVQVDVSANFLMNERFILGAAYRLNAAVSAMAGFYIDDGFLIGLAYDRETTELGKAVFNNGSFEVLIRYDFKMQNKGRLRSPRFF